MSGREKEKRKKCGGLFTRMRSLSSTCLAGHLAPHLLQLHGGQLSLALALALSLSVGNKRPVEQALQGRPDVIVPNSVGSVQRGHCIITITIVVTMIILSQDSPDS